MLAIIDKLSHTQPNALRQIITHNWKPI